MGKKNYGELEQLSRSFSLSKGSAGAEASLENGLMLSRQVIQKVLLMPKHLQRGCRYLEMNGKIIPTVQRYGEDSRNLQG